MSGVSTGIVVGDKKGFPVEKLDQKKGRISRRKGVSFLNCPSRFSQCLTSFFPLFAKRLGKRVKIVREVIREVSGLNPYEKRLLDMLRTGGATVEKRMYKFGKLRLGTHKRSLAKREEMKNIYSAMRAAGRS
jgi:large subunit ribosomal protein L36e